MLSESTRVIPGFLCKSDEEELAALEAKHDAIATALTAARQTGGSTATTTTRVAVLSRFSTRLQFSFIEVWPELQGRERQNFGWCYSVGACSRLFVTSWTDKSRRSFESKFNVLHSISRLKICIFPVYVLCKHGGYFGNRISLMPSTTHHTKIKSSPIPSHLPSHPIPS